MTPSDRRIDIMREALALVAEQGFHGAPMAEIAAKAGVAAGTIYRYFPSRDRLLAEIYQELEDRIGRMVREGDAVGRPVRERFLGLHRAVFTYFIAHPLHFRYMEQYFNSPYGITLHRDRLLGRSGNADILMDLFDQGIRQEVLKALPRAALFSLATGPMMFLIRDHTLGFITLDDALIEQTAQACWDAIKR
ncbi:MAG TPA: TetR/AcrR family transcriptional regulator [Syntrophales bacterium]|nr:TetR/AcrR family transcriptional regulator [Syntrophales bacterium]